MGPLRRLSTTSAFRDNRECWSHTLVLPTSAYRDPPTTNLLPRIRRERALLKLLCCTPASVQVSCHATPARASLPHLFPSYLFSLVSASPPVSLTAQFHTYSASCCTNGICAPNGSDTTEEAGARALKPLNGRGVNGFGVLALTEFDGECHYKVPSHHTTQHARCAHPM